MATVLSGLLVGVAVGLTQLDHLQQIQQEGHLRYELITLILMERCCSSTTIFGRKFHPGHSAFLSTRLNNRVLTGRFCHFQERGNSKDEKSHPVVGLGYELFEEAVEGEVQVRPQLLQQLRHLRQQSFQTFPRLKTLNM